MRVRSLSLAPGFEERQKQPGASPDKSRRRVSVPRAPASPLNDVSSRVVSIHGGDASLN